MHCISFDIMVFRSKRKRKRQLSAQYSPKSDALKTVSTESKDKGNLPDMNWAKLKLVLQIV